MSVGISCGTVSVGIGCGTEVALGTGCGLEVALGPKVALGAEVTLGTGCGTVVAQAVPPKFVRKECVEDSEPKVVFIPANTFQ